jgi:hypothetical protein
MRELTLQTKNLQELKTMADRQMELTVEITRGVFSGLSARDSEGVSYDVSLQFVPKNLEHEQEVDVKDDPKPDPGRWCCKDDLTVCSYVSDAPPCPEGSYEVNTKVKMLE